MGANLMLAIMAVATLGMVTILVYLLLELSKKAKTRYQEQFEKTATSNLADMFLFVDSAQLFSMNMVALAIGPLILFIFTTSLLLTAIGCVVIVAAPNIFYRVLRQRRFASFETQLPDALAMLSGSMRAGASFPVALESVVKASYPPLSQEFELFLRQIRLGVDFDQALVAMTKRMPIPDFVLVVSAIRIAREVGGNLGEILDSLAETIRQKQAMEGKIRGLTAQGKMQGLVMTGLPVLLVVVLFFLEPDGMRPLVTTLVGFATLTVITIMLALGYFFITRITAIDV
ncbi:MAG: type II secretion system F family protein [Nitrospinae bacterium]|nr:type II secretion system F family protein [Nitrospinota bacterium]